MRKKKKFQAVSFVDFSEYVIQANYRSDPLYFNIYVRFISRN